MSQQHQANTAHHRNGNFQSATAASRDGPSSSNAWLNHHRPTLTSWSHSAYHHTPQNPNQIPYSSPWDDHRQHHDRHDNHQQLLPRFIWVKPGWYREPHIYATASLVHDLSQRRWHAAAAAAAASHWYGANTTQSQSQPISRIPCDGTVASWLYNFIVEYSEGDIMLPAVWERLWKDAVQYQQDAKIATVVQRQRPEHVVLEVSFGADASGHDKRFWIQRSCHVATAAWCQAGTGDVLPDNLYQYIDSNDNDEEEDDDDVIVVLRLRLGIVDRDGAVWRPTDPIYHLLGPLGTTSCATHKVFVQVDYYDEYNAAKIRNDSYYTLPRRRAPSREELRAARVDRSTDPRRSVYILQMPLEDQFEGKPAAGMPPRATLPGVSSLGTRAPSAIDVEVAESSTRVGIKRRTAPDRHGIRDDCEGRVEKDTRQTKRPRTIPDRIAMKDGDDEDNARTIPDRVALKDGDDEDNEVDVNGSLDEGAAVDADAFVSEPMSQESGQGITKGNGPDQENGDEESESDTDSSDEEEGGDEDDASSGDETHDDDDDENCDTRDAAAIADHSKKADAKTDKARVIPAAKDDKSKSSAEGKGSGDAIQSKSGSDKVTGKTSALVKVPTALPGTVSEGSDDGNHETAQATKRPNGTRDGVGREDAVAAAAADSARSPPRLHQLLPVTPMTVTQSSPPPPPPFQAPQPNKTPLQDAEAAVQQKGNTDTNDLDEDEDSDESSTSSDSSTSSSHSEDTEIEQNRDADADLKISAGSSAGKSEKDSALAEQQKATANGKGMTNDDALVAPRKLDSAQENDEEDDSSSTSSSSDDDSSSSSSDSSHADDKKEAKETDMNEQTGNEATETARPSLNMHDNNIDAGGTVEVESDGVELNEVARKVDEDNDDSKDDDGDEEDSASSSSSSSSDSSAAEPSGDGKLNGALNGPVNDDDEEESDSEEDDSSTSSSSSESSSSSSDSTIPDPPANSKTPSNGRNSLTAPVERSTGKFQRRPLLAPDRKIIIALPKTN